MRMRRKPEGQAPRWKLCLDGSAALLFGLIGAGEIPRTRFARPQQHPLAQGERRHRAGRDRREVASRSRALALAAPLPAELINRLSEAGAKRTFIDIIFNGRTIRRDDNVSDGRGHPAGRYATVSARSDRGTGGQLRIDAATRSRAAARANGPGQCRYNFRQAVGGWITLPGRG